MKPNTDEFFEKYGFQITTSKKHPVYDDMMTFTGLEADYVSSLERDVDHYKRMLMDVMANNERLISRESYRLHDELKKIKFDKENK